MTKSPSAKTGTSLTELNNSRPSFSLDCLHDLLRVGGGIGHSTVFDPELRPKGAQDKYGLGVSGDLLILWKSLEKP